MIRSNKRCHIKKKCFYLKRFNISIDGNLPSRSNVIHVRMLNFIFKMTLAVVYFKMSVKFYI